MNTRSILLVLSLALILLTACTPSETLPESTFIPLSETSSGPRSPTSPSSPTGSCVLTRTFLDGLSSSLPFEQTVITHQSYGGEESLGIWLVSQEIIPTNADQSLATAELQAIQVSKALVDANPCLLEIETMQLTVVDAEYQLWFSGSLRTIDLPNLQTEEIGGGAETEQGGGRESLPPNTESSAGPDACTWQELALQLKNDFSSRQVDAAFTFIRDAGGNIVYAQWSVPDQGAALNILDNVMAIAGQASCLFPPTTGISILLTLPNGQTLLSGFLPIDPTQGADPAAFTFNIIAQP